MRIDLPASLEDRWLEIFRELGNPVALLACTFTFNADFFAGLLKRLGEAVCESGKSDGGSFSHVPIDVVCDLSRYKGHRVGVFNVRGWPVSARLFHPKIFIALFPHIVVWSDRPSNLTPPGWYRNREIAMLHRPRRKTLPAELRELLRALPDVAAAKCIHDATFNQLTVDLPGQFLTSLNTPIGSRFLSHAPKRADEVHLIAPFFERSESADVPIDASWLQLLAKRYREARFHVYLPMLEASPLRVQGQRQLFEMLERQLTHRVALHPVAEAPGPLHGKAACVVHAPRRIQRAYLLVGSPNMTCAALLPPTRRGNIECAWILDQRWQDAKRVFFQLGSKGKSIDDAEFTDPPIGGVEAWMPLRRATFDPLKRVLSVEWRNASDAGHTVLRYAGSTLSLEKGKCRNFDLVDGIGWVVTRKRGGDIEEGCCPIEVPVVLLPACQSGAPRRTPEEWLTMLGAVWGDGSERGKGGAAKLSRGPKRLPIDRFEWSKRVRDLAARMRYLEAALGDETLNSVEKEWLQKLVAQIYDSHNPATIENTHEQVWRAWVRLELWQAAENLKKSSPTKLDRVFWRESALRMRRRLGAPEWPQAIRRQLRIVVKSLRGLA